jgi:predicted O-methyltransferase YrrM
MTVQSTRLAALLAPAFAIALVASASAQTTTVQRDVPYVPTPEHVVKRMLELANIKKGEFMMDLGSGDGRIAIAAVRDHGATAVGIDIDPQRISEANENAKKAGVSDRVTFKQENIFTTSIKEADVITMYLLTSVNQKLRPRLLDELRPGTRLVSHAFDMGDWEADIYETVDGRSVYMWVVPAKVDGEWTVKDGAQTFNVKFNQRFQMLMGNANVGGKELPVKNGKLDGAQISFTLDLNGKPATFVGKVDGNRIESAAGPRGQKREWSADKKG